MKGANINVKDDNFDSAPVNMKPSLLVLLNYARHFNLSSGRTSGHQNLVVFGYLQCIDNARP